MLSRKFLFVLLSYLVFQFPSDTYSLVRIPLCNHHDASALLSFKSVVTIVGPSDYDWCEGRTGVSCDPKTESWRNDTNCCMWDGVSCDTESGHVIGLDLSCSCIHAELHPNNTLFQLIHLQTLNLVFNDFFYSSMPSGLGNLVALTHLNLSFSWFNGIIPSKFSHLSKLVSLDLSNNNGMTIESVTLEKLIENATRLRELTLNDLDMSLIKPGSLSLLLNFSSSLAHLALQDTNLRGKFENKIFCLPNLQHLDLSYNPELEGELPEFNWSTPLRYIALGDTIFSGEIPLSLSNLQHLTYIDLSDNSFTGPIPQCMGNISQLNYLVLRSNNFSGQIPSSLFDLQHLIYLDLSYNNFDGEMPNLFDKLSKLEVLGVSKNNLVGQLPSSLFQLTRLSDLRLSENNLVGEIPHQTSELSNLAYLDLSVNSLNGTIPPWCFSLSSLIDLNLGGNQLTGLISEFRAFSLDYCDLSNYKLQGDIPKSIFLLQNLLELRLSSNNLSGLIDLKNFSNLHELQILDLSENNFQSLEFNGGNVKSFPKSPTQLHYLDLYLSKNQIRGRIPEGFDHMADTLGYLDLSHNFLTSVGNLSLSRKNICYIDLSFNMLEGDIPVPSSTAQFFSISNNKFTGDISSSLCNASSLTILNLSHNNLIGKLPQCVGNLSNLLVLDLQRNNLCGIIPRSYLEISALETMNFNGNQLEGPLPRPVIIEWQKLRVLDLGENNIQDTFPSWLESLQELQVLVLRANRFNGTINCFQPKNNIFSKLTVFDISNNNFQGNLPVVFFKNFKGMMINVHNDLQYINTEFTYNDSVEVTLKGNTIELERILTTLTIVDLANNRFEGAIPTIIGELKSLIGLNLSNNRITGFIPQKLCGLENLEWLDLSSNMLTGEIPTALANLPFLSFLNLSQNLLVGKIPTGKQFNTFQNDSYRDNPRLCGWPLSKSCYKDEKREKDPETFHHDEQQFGFGWKPVVIGYAFGMVFGTLSGYIVFFVWKPRWSIYFVDAILNQRLRKKSHRNNANTRQHNEDS